MTDFMFIFFSILWAIIAVLDYSEFCYVWQLKEYRYDRFRDFLSTKQGKKFLKSYLVSGRLILLALMILVWTLEAKWLLLIIAILLSAESVRYIFRSSKKHFRHPQITAKAALVVLVALGVELAAWIFSKDIAVLLGLFCLRFLVISAVVTVFGWPTKLLKKIYVARAERKLKKYLQLQVVGVTGSFGKTTIKNFLVQILGASFKVIATPKNINTEIGIAKFILDSDFSGKDIFVVEMAAYGRGEIKVICDMVHPAIGILSAINEQHLSLFGSLENIRRTKFELLDSLAADGLAIVNSDNRYCRENLSGLVCGIKTYGSTGECNPDCLVKNIKTEDDGSISFALSLKNKTIEIQAPILGEHNAANIAACVLVAEYLGMSERDIKEQIGNLQLPEGTLRTHTYGKSVIIDDSYNSNPDGFLAALKVLDQYPGRRRKVVITRGMLELGKKSQVLHEKVSQYIEKVADELIIISRDNEDDLRRHLKNVKASTILSADKLLEYVKRFKEEKNAVLLENRIPDNSLRELTGR